MARFRDSASNTLAELGYKVQYLRDPEIANKALTTVLNAGHKLLGLDLETMPKPAYANCLKAGLDPHLADIRLCQVATPDGTVLVFDMLHLPTGLLEPLMEQPWVSHNAGFEWRFLKAAGLQPGTPHYTRLMSRVATGRSGNYCRFMSRRRAGYHPGNAGVPHVCYNASWIGGIRDHVLLWSYQGTA